MRAAILCRRVKVSEGWGEIHYVQVFSGIRYLEAGVGLAGDPHDRGRCHERPAPCREDRLGRTDLIPQPPAAGDALPRGAGMDGRMDLALGTTGSTCGIALTTSKA